MGYWQVLFTGESVGPAVLVVEVMGLLHSSISGYSGPKAVEQLNSIAA